MRVSCFHQFWKLYILEYCSDVSSIMIWSQLFLNSVIIVFILAFTTNHSKLQQQVFPIMFGNSLYTFSDYNRISQYNGFQILPYINSATKILSIIGF